MTDPSGNRKTHLALGIRLCLEKLTIALGFASDNSQLFPGSPESLEPDIFSGCTHDQSLLVLSVLVFYFILTVTCWFLLLNFADFL